MLLPYSIVKSTITDASELNKLINSAYRGEYSKKGWTTEADLLDGLRTDQTLVEEIIRKESAEILIYLENQKILGCVRLDNKGTKLYLGMLTVEPSNQNKGIGKKLLNAAEEEARHQGCSSIYMTVISVRAKLIAWYNRHGYIDTGKRIPFDSSDPRFGIPKTKLEFIVMEKEIF